MSEFVLGLRRDIPDVRDFQWKDVALRAYPATIIDYTPQLEMARDQGSLGSCACFALACIRGYQENRQRNGKYITLSPLHLYIANQQFPGGGTYSRDILEFAVKNGISPEEWFPYDELRPKTDSEKLVYNPDVYSQHTAARRYARRMKAGAYARINNIEEAINSLALNGPFMLGIEWQRQWFNGNRMLEACENSGIGGHAVVVSGVNTEAQYFFIRNQGWENWGINGNGALTFEAFERHMWDAWAIYDKEFPGMNPNWKA